MLIDLFFSFILLFERKQQTSRSGTQLDLFYLHLIIRIMESTVSMISSESDT